MRSDLEPRLRGLYRPPLAGQAEHQRAHEGELLALAARRRGGAGRGVPVRAAGRLRSFRMPRLALAGVLGVAVAVGACMMPAEYPMSLGYGFELVVPLHRLAEVDPQAIAERLQDHPGVERIELRMQHSQRERARGDGTVALDEDVRLQLFLLGDAVDADALQAELRASFPVLADIELREVPLSGTVHGTLGGQLSHRFLDITIDRHGVEEAERRVLAALVAEGVDVQRATVDITEEHGADGARRIEVRVEAELPEPAPASAP